MPLFTHLTTTAVLAAVAAVSLLAPEHGADQAINDQKQISIHTEHPTLPTQTISSRVISAPATPQRWVF